MLSELAEDGQSRNNYRFNAEMTFYQAGDKVNSLSGNGVEAVSYTHLILRATEELTCKNITYKSASGKS